MELIETVEPLVTEEIIEKKPLNTITEDEPEPIVSPFPLVVDLSALTKKITNKHLLKLTQKNPHLIFETRGFNQLVITMPTHTKTGKKNHIISSEVYIWNKEHEMGSTYDSSTGFRMPITQSILSPDVSFVKQTLLDTIDTEADDFYLIAPTFVIELMSGSDLLRPAKEKMVEYLQNGVELAWLIQPKKRRTFVYRQKDFVQNITPTEQSFDVVLSGEDILPNFMLDLREIFGN